MDELDLKLLDLLAQDARQSHKVLSEKLKLSQAAISRRIEGLIKAGIIKTFSTVLDYEKIGISVHAVMVVDAGRGFRDTDGAIKNLLAIPNILYVAQTFGDHDFHVGVVVKNSRELTTIARLVSECTGDGHVVTYPAAQYIEKIPSVSALTRASEGR